MTHQILKKFLDGIEEIIPYDDTLALLEKGQATIKFGADPSAPDLHLGHLVILNKLRLLQDLGNKIIFVIGDFTAMIGDPTGKTTTRPPLSESDVHQNAQTYQDQIFKILDPKKTEITFNSTWLSKLTAKDMINIAAKYTVARMLERDDFNTRFKNEIPISIHEFLYPLLQGYDSVALKNTIEIGGTDQKFNLLVGRQLQKEANIPPQGIIMCPILEGLDGKQKMSKSLNNQISITDSPTEIYGKLMSIPDSLILRYFRLLTDTEPDDILAMKTKIDAGENPKLFKERLAKTIVTQRHNKQAATSAHDEFKEIFKNKGLPDTIPTLHIPNPISMSLVDLIIEHQIMTSKKEVRRLIAQGAISIDQTKIDDPFYTFLPQNEQILKIGKRQFFKLITKPSI